MLIAFDGSTLRPRRTGVGYYTEHLLRHLAEEAPNDDIAMQVLLELGKLGNIRTKTLKAWSLAEATKVVSKLQ